MALIFAGVLALPFPSTSASRTAQNERAAVEPAAITAAGSMRTNVVVAKTSLAAHTVLTADNIELRAISSEAVQPNAATALNEVLSKALTVPVAAGEQILTHQLDNPGMPLQRAPSVMIPGRAAAQITATDIRPTNLKVGDTIDVKITVKNTFDKPLLTMGPEPGFTYVQGQTYFTQQYASDPGKWRVAIGMAGLDATELPYRWGLGGALAPGASTTVTGHVKVTQDFKATSFWAALVNEPGAVVQTGVGMTLVHSLPENLAIVAVDRSDLRRDATPTTR